MGISPGISTGSSEISFTHEIVKSRGIITIFIIKDAIDLFFMI
ncbi:unknown [Bacteroides fragilis CAG:47]|nr:unknown [Bacteroides fragilis CAG:47]